VLAAALGVGTLVSNDLVLGRRAANLGVRWLRTADLLILCVKTGGAVGGRPLKLLTYREPAPSFVSRPG